jgi:hypothetical protein
MTGENLEKVFKEIIEKEFGGLKEMTPEKRAEVFIACYMILVNLTENDFDLVTSLKIQSVTKNKEEEKKDVVSDR